MPRGDKTGPPRDSLGPRDGRGQGRGRNIGSGLGRLTGGKRNINQNNKKSKLNKF